MVCFSDVQNGASQEEILKMLSVTFSRYFQLAILFIIQYIDTLNWILSSTIFDGGNIDGFGLS